MGKRTRTGKGRRFDRAAAFFGFIDKLGVIIQGILTYNSPAFPYHVPRCKFSLRQTNRFLGMFLLEKVF